MCVVVGGIVVVLACCKEGRGAIADEGGADRVSLDDFDKVGVGGEELDGRGEPGEEAGVSVAGDLFRLGDGA